MAYGCATCHEDFGPLKAFDKHLPPIKDGPKQDPCKDPESVGLVRSPTGKWTFKSMLRSGTPDFGLTSNAPEQSQGPRYPETLSDERRQTGPLRWRTFSSTS